MRHVFVETNWVFAYAAPAHHKRLDAVELLARARANEVRIHLPAPCLTEARPPIMRKCHHETKRMRSGNSSCEQRRNKQYPLTKNVPREKCWTALK